MITYPELSELKALIGTLNEAGFESLKFDASVIDSNGECLGEVTWEQGVGYVFQPSPA